MPERQYEILARSSDYNEPYGKAICVDTAYRATLFKILQTIQKQKKWDYLVRRILTSRILPTDIYGPEGYDDDTKDVFAIKFHDKDNTRIYCKQIVKDGKELLIICSEIEERKKVQKNDTRINAKIKIVSSYVY